ncbi:hypothetical protein DFJ43DRAFT_1160836 [Lentinula guzmanii]|uniref:Uncharacterized protein n=1 Tax=Lentinula guzmanii TaxID=2804957 RepID=A0AA38J2Q8_9AGAR|nr:hypothetical protein DFJ43DRAFT_1160836 [Lentinula guzmanii]
MICSICSSSCSSPIHWAFSPISSNFFQHLQLRLLPSEYSWHAPWPGGSLPKHPDARPVWLEVAQTQAHSECLGSHLWNATKEAPLQAQRKPSLMDGFSVPKIEDCITSALSPAGQPLDVINLSLQGRLPFPSSIQRKDHDLPSNQVFYLHQETSYSRRFIVAEHFWKDTGERNDTTSSVAPIHRHSSHPLLFTDSIAFLSNLGRANSLSKAPRLRAIALRTGTTIKDLVTLHRKEFAVRPAITHRNFLIVNFIITEFHNERPAVKISLADFGLGLEVIARHHRCLSIRTYATFREDFDALLPHGFLHLFVDEDSLEDHYARMKGACLLKRRII